MYLRLPMKNDDEISKKDKIVFGTGILITVLVIGVTSFLFYNYKRVESNQKKIVIEPTITPIATEKPQIIDYKNTEIQVLNGSGIACRAKKLTDELKNMGYLKVTAGNYENVITGNILESPTDFGKSINLENYKFQKSDVIKIIIGK